VRLLCLRSQVPQTPRSALVLDDPGTVDLCGDDGRADRRRQRKVVEECGDQLPLAA